MNRSAVGVMNGKPCWVQVVARRDHFCRSQRDQCPAGWFWRGLRFFNSFQQPELAPPDWPFAPVWLFLNATSLVALSRIATTAQTLAELELEIETLKGLDKLSKKVVDQRCDAKWSELDRILDDEQMREPNGGRRKLVLFTEFKDTLTDMAIKIRDRLGRPEAVVEIHGGSLASATLRSPRFCSSFWPPGGRPIDERCHAWPQSPSCGDRNHESDCGTFGRRDGRNPGPHR
ncbi:tryptophan-rich sensory protein [Synechococcus sp. CS-1324]|nr:tryptophan-rich sensory protein [Synechococcus sp. CS-1324]PZV05242.1 MAG: hypothetical protein DCF23_03930 [Cyanobium sp.]